MRVTNNYHLPEPIVNAVARNYKPQEKRISVTSLIGSPRVYRLTQKHWDDIEIEVMDNSQALPGIALHKFLSGKAKEGAEEKLEIEIDGWTIVGRTDLFQEGVLTDYKMTSVFSFMLGEKKEWERQLNAYAWLLRKHDREVKKVQVVAFLRDWMRTKVNSEKDYPPHIWHTVDVPLWSLEKQEEYVLGRLNLFRSEEEYFCTKEERWERPASWAVKRDGMKKATRVLTSESEARMIATSLGLGYSVEFRKGVNTKCASYCNVAPFCTQYRDINGGLFKEVTVAKPLSDVVKVILALKISMGVEPGDEAWDKLNYARTKKVAGELLEYFKDWKLVAECVQELSKKFNDLKFNWTYETLAKHCSDWRVQNGK